MRNGFKVADLSGDAVDVTSTPIDWQEARGEDGDGWESFEGMACEGCGSIVALRCGEGNGPHCDCADGADLLIDCNGHVATAEGPMMSYFYRVKLDDCEGAARTIAHLPLCVVEFRDGETALALTGGGMDLSWEICEAFALLGYAPPLAFCNLPAMAGYTLTPQRRRIIAACRRSVAIAKRRAEYAGRRLAELARGMKAPAKRAATGGR